jgi:hypothetical protein
VSDLVFVYARDGIVKALDYNQAIKVAAQMECDGWKRTATIGFIAWIEWLCNTAPQYGLNAQDAVNELAGIKPEPAPASIGIK